MSSPSTSPRYLRPVDAAEVGVHEPRAAETVNAEDEPLRKVRLNPAAGIRLKPTYWLWDERIPQGAITLGPGREGIGKSLFCAWLAAQVTHGRLSGVHHGKPRGVVYAATEDSWERTIAGRLIAAGADMSRVYNVEVENTVSKSSVPLTLPRDCRDLAAEMAAHDVALLVLDPLISVVDSAINPNSEGLRDALEPLAKLADTTGAAIFGLAHFNKATGTDVLSRITGSRAFSAVARAVIAFARDTTADDGSCVLSQVKNNLGRLDLPSLRYTIEPVTLDTDEGPAQWGRLQMLGETTTSVAQLLDDAPGDNGDDRSEVDGWLTDYLDGEGGSAAAADVLTQGQRMGYSRDQLKRAKKRLGVIAAKAAMQGGWTWQLPTGAEGGAEGSEGSAAQ